MSKPLYNVEKNIPVRERTHRGEIVDFLYSLKQGDSFIVPGRCKATYLGTKIKKLGGQGAYRPLDLNKREGTFRFWVVRALDARSKTQRSDKLVKGFEKFLVFPKMPDIWEAIKQDKGINVNNTSSSYREGVVHCSLAIRKLMYREKDKKSEKSKLPYKRKVKK